jgi:hypothetical protein
MRPHRDHEGRWTLRPVIWGLVVAIVIVVAVLTVGVLPWALRHVGRGMGLW